MIRRRQHYTWGSLSNTAPPEDDDYIAGYYGIPVLQCPIEQPQDDREPEEPQFWVASQEQR